MKIRIFALAGATALALIAPAAQASDATGWYVDVAGGWDHLGDIKTTFGSVSQKGETDDSMLLTGAWGYRFESRIRLEGEIGWDHHNISTVGTNGHVEVGSALANIAYDVPLSPRWDLSIGGGVGGGRASFSASGVGFGFNGSPTGLMYQGFAGVAYSLADNVDLTVDFRYRKSDVSETFGTTKFSGFNEEAVMVGL